MPISSRMTFPYPTENQDPFYEEFTGMVEAIDASVYASREDRHLVVTGGGLITFTVSPSGEGTLTWAQDIQVLAAITGHQWSITAGSITLANNHVAYINLPRAPVQSVRTTMLAQSQVANTDAGLLIGLHTNSIFYFRNGRCIHDGESFNALEISTNSSGGSSSSTRALKDPCRVATTADVTLAGGAPDVVDGITLEVDDRVLVRNQADTSENGIYIVASLGSGSDGVWVRASDFAASADVLNGALCVVTSGTASSLKMFELIALGVINLGSTLLQWYQLGSVGNPGQHFISEVTVAMNQNTSMTTPQTIGHYAVNVNDYALAGTTLTTLVHAVGFVTGTAEGSVDLYDVGAATTIATIVFDPGTTTPTHAVGAVVLPGGNTVLEMRIRVSSGTGTFFCSWAGIQFRNTL